MRSVAAPSSSPLTKMGAGTAGQMLLLGACICSFTDGAGANKTYCNPVNLAYRMHVRHGARASTGAPAATTASPCHQAGVPLMTLPCLCLCRLRCRIYRL